jgi:endonuclease III
VVKSKSVSVKMESTDDERTFLSQRRPTGTGTFVGFPPTTAVSKKDRMRVASSPLFRPQYLAWVVMAQTRASLRATEVALTVQDPHRVTISSRSGSAFVSTTRRFVKSRPSLDQNPFAKFASCPVEADDAEVANGSTTPVTPDTVPVSPRRSPRSLPSSVQACESEHDPGGTTTSGSPSARREAKKRSSQAADTPRSPAKKRASSKSTTLATTVDAAMKRTRLPPDGWFETYELVKELRKDRTAPCDLMGCEALADKNLLPANPAQYRFHILVALMLSSQTKDAVVGDAVRNMQRDNVLSVDAIHAMDTEALNRYISKVGFHNNKTKYLKQVAAILKTDFGSDIPRTAQQMIKELPGVGPKMAFIAECAAWGTSSGIGVDTHMHRLFPLLKWVDGPKCKSPEQTRVELEKWLPELYWGEINLLFVGFGQEIQQYPEKILRKALYDCSNPVKALCLLKQCGMDLQKQGEKFQLREEIQTALAK